MSVPIPEQCDHRTPEVRLFFQALCRGKRNWPNASQPPVEGGVPYKPSKHKWKGGTQPARGMTRVSLVPSVGLHTHPNVPAWKTSMAKHCIIHLIQCLNDWYNVKTSMWCLASHKTLQGAAWKLHFGCLPRGADIKFHKFSGLESWSPCDQVASQEARSGPG